MIVSWRVNTLSIVVISEDSILMMIIIMIVFVIILLMFAGHCRVSGFLVQRVRLQGIFQLIIEVHSS